ncbi:MAG: translation initiation factor IF-2 [Synergistaceae bacterium]|nr:translation initiation factor IF-2 [Synergistaceae bacterium]
MAKMRISTYAKNLETTSAKILEIARKLNIDVKNHCSNLDDEAQNKIANFIAQESQQNLRIEENVDVKSDIDSFPKVAVGFAPTLQEVAKAMKVPFGILAKNLMLAGMMKPPTSKADDQTLEALSRTFKVNLVREDISKEHMAATKKNIEVTVQNISEIENIDERYQDFIDEYDNNNDAKRGLKKKTQNKKPKENVSKDTEKQPTQPIQIPKPKAKKEKKPKSPKVIQPIIYKEKSEKLKQKHMEKINKKNQIEVKSEVKPRPPIITVMGHVDHGKTTLLDSIRKTRVTAREAGGITQHIGASCVEYNGQTIVFLDTPGHEAFTEMRARGASVTDIAVLVVAADDGIKPQTVEAINHAKAANVPIVVAVNKIDKPDANPDKVRQQLTEYGLISEDWGGDTVMINVAAKTGQNIDELLEMLLLVAEMQELKADPLAEARGTVIEANLDKGKGAVATVIVQEGTLKRGDIIQTGSTWGKIRAMYDDHGKLVMQAGPSTPVEILGLEGVPTPGEEFTTMKNEKDARELIEQNMIAKKESESNAAKKLTLEELFNKMQTEELPLLCIVLKTDVQGSLEAIRSSLNKMSNDSVAIKIIHEGVGRISESDITLASASNAIVIGFNVRPDNGAKNLAEREGIQIRLYQVIYDMLDDVKAAMEGMLAPDLREEILGTAEIREIFRIPKIGNIAGCRVTEGLIRRSANVRLIRDGIVYWSGTLDALKHFKDDAKEINAGNECGMSFERFQDFRTGDVVECFEVIEEKKLLD